MAEYWFDFTLGSNLDTGLDIAHPKKDFTGAGGFNYIAFFPDDIINFKCGEDFTNGQDGSQYSYNGSHGTLGHPIILRSYGVGAKPILPTINCTSAPGAYYWQFGNGDGTLGLEIQPNDALNPNADGIFFDYPGRGDGILIDACDFKPGIGTMDSAVYFLVASDIIIRNCECDTDNGGFGVDGDASGLGGNWRIYNNTIYSTSGGQDGISIHSNGGVYHLAPNHYIYDNVIYNFGENCIDLGGAEYCYVYHNELYNADESVIVTGYYARHIYIFQNFIQNDGMYCLNFMTGYNYLYNNIIEVIGASSYGIISVYFAYSATFARIHHLYFYHNTYVNVANVDRYIIDFVCDTNYWGTDAGSICFKNNVMVSKTLPDASLKYMIRGTYAIEFSNALFDINYNCYGGVFAADDSGSAMNWAQWQADGHDVNGLNTDPLLVDVTKTDRDYTDYMLQAGSPCIGQAVAISTGSYFYYDAGETNCIHSMTGIIVDYLGASRATSSDMGAFEYGLPPSTHSIKGTILEGGVGLILVNVSDGSRSDDTDVNGLYEITGVPDGSYTVTPTKAGYTFSPPTRNVVVSGGDQTGIDFTANALLPGTLVVSNIHISNIHLTS